MGINRNSPVPIADQIAADLRRRIADGEIVERLPSLKALASEYEVAAMTVQAALKTLQAEGIVSGVSGRGTFVRNTPTEPDTPARLDELASLRRDVDEMRGRLDAIERVVGIGAD